MLFFLIAAPDRTT